MSSSLNTILQTQTRFISLLEFKELNFLPAHFFTGSCDPVFEGCGEEFVALTLTSADSLTSCQSVMKAYRWVLRYLV